MKKITLFLILLSVSFIVEAQSSWKKLNIENVAFKGTSTFRKNQPKKYTLYNLELDSFKKQLTSQNRGTKKTIELPNHDGIISTFYIIESSNFTEPVNSKYGFIKSYSLQSIENNATTGKMSIGKDGVHVAIYSTSKPTFYIDPYTKDNKTYISYSRADISKQVSDFHCLVKEHQQSKEKVTVSRNANDGKLRTFRLALSSTNEYSQFHIINQGLVSGTDTQKKAAVLSAMNTTIARVNGIFERDLSIKVNIVLNNGENPLINIDINTEDNLSNDDDSALLNENQTLCDTVIGSANYDVGHVFTTGGGGVAFLGSVCLTGAKAGGVTGLPSPIGDPYDIDFVAHELGHQFGGPHTFNGNTGNCDPPNRNDATAVEPGSGTTIMGYAGICDPQNVQNNSDDYFHAISIQDIWNTIQTRATCATETDTGNNPPTANAGGDYIVPRLTPLKLNGSGTDPDGNASLTYCWEQMDNEITAPIPFSGSTAGALFRSLPPKRISTRYLPTLTEVVQGNLFTKWEVLPSVAREMNFSLTVRDNNPNGGSTARDDMKITVVDVDPFSVTAPNTAVTWDTGTTQTITWDKSTTDQAPINCKNVRIKLSLDGGATFPIILVDSTPNDGSHDFIVPDNATTTARIMVEAVDNIFYHTNSTNITINSTTPTFTVDTPTIRKSACNIGNITVEYDLNFDFINGFNETVSLNASNVPTGANITFSPTTINSDGTVKMTITNLDGIASDIYDITIEATSTSISQTANVELQILDTSFPTFSLQSPTDGDTGISIIPILSWDDITQATSYDIEIATDNAFNNIVFADNSNTNSYSLSKNPLEGLSEYFWRVKAKNTCGGESDYTNVSRFTTMDPVYCTSLFTDEAGGTEHITNVTFNTINNTSGNDTVDGYEDFTSIFTNLKAGETHTINVTFNPVGFQDHCYVFIDWNKDLIFDTTNERYDLGTLSGTTGTNSLDITVPSDVRDVVTRMRVVVEYFDGNVSFGTGACDSDHATEWGETEDYTISLGNAVASVDDFNFGKFNLYPNPSNGIFNISFKVLDTEKVEIEVHDIRGRVVKSSTYRNTRNTFSEELNLDNLNSGLYLLQIKNGNKQSTKKIIIK